MFILAAALAQACGDGSPSSSQGGGGATTTSTGAAGSGAGGGTTTGGSTSGGGGSGTGGTGTGGATGGSGGGGMAGSGGMNTGGMAGSGGMNTGGMNTGGMNTGGMAGSGGMNTGGMSTGGMGTGGMGTGGMGTGGMGTGGVVGQGNWMPPPPVQMPPLPPAPDYSQYPVDSQGRPIVASSGGIDLVVPLSLDAIGARELCADLVANCVEPGVRSIDACMMSAPHCQSPTPWTEAAPCCADACFTAYAALRNAHVDPLSAYLKVLYHTPICMPGVDAKLGGMP